MFCTCKDLQTEVTSFDVRNKLYGKMKESISDDALNIFAILVNAVRKISYPNKVQNNVFNGTPIRQLRNVLVEFAGRRTKFGSSKLYVEKSRENDSVEVNCSTLYLLFQKAYDMFTSHGEKFSNYLSIRSTEQKEDLKISLIGN